MLVLKKELKEILERIKNNDPTLTELFLNNLGLEVDDAKDIAGALAQNTMLKTLSLHFNHITHEGAAAIADVLTKNNTLTSLNIASNNIGDKGAEFLAKALAKNTSLTNLDLRSNYITDEGAAAIAGVLEKNTTLTSLDLAANNIGNDGYLMIIDGLSDNDTLISLNLDNNQIEYEENNDVIDPDVIDPEEQNQKLNDIMEVVNMIPKEILDTILFSLRGDDALAAFINDSLEARNIAGDTDVQYEAIEA